MRSTLAGLLLAVFILTPLHAAPPPPVVIELFTSEGCSSCPPAEELFARLVDEPGVIALGFHVDYWNKLGWTDPYSRPEWSRRQGRYSATFAANQVYTPQLVAGGVAECVGSDETKVRAAIAAARTAPSPARVTLVVAKPVAGKLPVAARYDTSGDIEVKPLALVVALFEDGLATEVRSGENAGQKLTHQRVVRHLVLPVLTGTAGQLELPLDPAWRVDRLGVAAFVQDARMRILGAAVARP